ASLPRAWRARARARPIPRRTARTCAGARGRACFAPGRAHGCLDRPTRAQCLRNSSASPCETRCLVRCFRRCEVARQARARALQPRAQYVAAYPGDRFDLDEPATFGAQRQERLLRRLELEPGAVEGTLAFV